MRLRQNYVHTARLVRDLNFKHLNEGKGAPVTARFGDDGITIVDPTRASDGKVFQKIYANPISVGRDNVAAILIRDFAMALAESLQEMCK